MVSLPVKHPAVETEFQNGKFVVRKSPRAFSAIPIDQAHEQNNKCVKTDGGAVGLTENTSELLRWMVSGPEIARVIQDFETSQELMQQSRNPDSHTQHHEQTRHTQSTFQNQVTALVDVMSRMGNPFIEESSDFVILNSRNIADVQVATTVRNIDRIGLEQFEEFVTKRLIQKTESVFASLKRNKLPLLRCPPAREVNKEKLHINSLKKSCSLFSQLYVSCQVRGCDLDEFFRHENQAYPPALSQFGTIRSGTKSPLLTCLETHCNTQDSTPNVDAKLFDGAAIVNILKPGEATTFQEYSEVFVNYLKGQLENVTRIDIVWDKYICDSLKSSTRNKRGKGVRRRVEASTKLPRNWDAFLRIDDNKTELFRYLAQQLVKIECGDKVVITTCDEVALSSSEYNLSALSPCTQEEADTRLMLHAADCVIAGHTRLLIRTVDTDVVTIAVPMCHKMPQITQFWIAFGVGKNYRYIPVHEIASSLGPEKSLALPVFHAFTGCDQTSFLFGRGKKTAWDIWKVFDEATLTFLALSESPDEQALAENMQVLERFVILMYDRTSNCSCINEARKELFTKKGRTMEVLPPTSAALIQHTKRVAFQAGYVWGQAVTAAPVLPCPSEWGWTRRHGQKWEPLWTTIPEAAKSCQQLIRCTCNLERGCRGHCKCAKSNLKCTALCKCDGDCDHGI